MAWRYAASNGSGLAANDMVLVRISSLFRVLHSIVYESSSANCVKLSEELVHMN